MRLCRLAFIGLLLLAALPIDLSAQQPPQQQASNRNDIPAITRTYAITNARIVVAPGQEIPRGTVVLRNG